MAIDWGLELFKVAPTAVVAGIAVYVAWKQWRLAQQQYEISRAKLNFDLFEERYELYSLLWSYLSARVGDLDKVEPVTVQLQNSAPRFLFLFGQEIYDFVMLALSKGIQQSSARTVTRQPYSQSAASEQANKTLTECYQWFFDEANSLRARFAVYMDFSAWASGDSNS